MRRLSRMGIGVVLALAAVAVGFGAELPLTNSDVVAMVNSGLGTATIVAKIKASATDFRLDTASLAILTQQGVPHRVIKAMIERQSPTRPDSEAQAWPRDDARKIWSDVVRVVDRCRSRGELMMLDAGVQFGPLQDSAACTDQDMRFTFLWDQIDTLCFKYIVIDEGTFGVLQLRTKGGKSCSLRASQLVMQAVEKEFKFQQPRLNYRCD